MECNEVMHQESTSLYQQMSKKDSQDWMDGQDHQEGSMEKSKTETSRRGDRNEKIEMGRAHTSEEQQQHSKEVPGLEPAGKEKEREATTHPDANSGWRCEEEWKELGGSEEDCPR